MRYLVASSTPFPPLSSVVHSFSFLVLHFSLQREKQQRFVTDGETLESICHVSTSVSFAALFSCALAYAARVLSLLLLLNPASRLVLPALRSPPLTTSILAHPMTCALLLTNLKAGAAPVPACPTPGAYRWERGRGLSLHGSCCNCSQGACGMESNLCEKVCACVCVSERVCACVCVSECVCSKLSPLDTQLCS